MKIKVCGMKHPENLNQVANLGVDMIGLIFYSKSPRFVESLASENIPKIKKVGVFVNETLLNIQKAIAKYNLDYIQLHGNESPEMCKSLRTSTPIIKAFSVSDPNDFEITKEYESVCDYFLFDTKTSAYGGSGEKFDWSILNTYKGTVPFFLSGGISPDDASAIKNVSHPLFEGIDLNSRFEIEPGLKNIELLKQFIRKIRNEQN